MTASILLGMELLRLLRYSVLISRGHIFRIASLNLGREEMSWFFRLFLIKFQAFSIRFRSCELPANGTWPHLAEGACCSGLP